jgi:hypothetical protein
MVIDLFGLTAEDVRAQFPKVYEHVLASVKPERDAKAGSKDGAAYARLWWLHGKPRSELRPALAGRSRYIATGETGKHRHFQFLEAAILPDNMLIAIASDDAFHLGVLSSRIHVVYALAAGGTLEDRPRYNKSRCFDPFPFPDCTEAQKTRIRALAEELDAHRKRAQATHKLGLTDIYNVLEKLRSASSDAGLTAGQAARPTAGPTMLTAKERAIHDAALVSTLKQLHDDLDRAVADAYGWPWPMTDAEILERVVALNAARAAEEATGLVRWLRPEYQKPLLAPAAQGTLALETGGKKSKPTTPANRKSKIGNRKLPKLAWPKTLAERVQAVETALTAAASPVTPDELAKRFLRAKPAEVKEILETLAALGRARPGDAKDTFVL